MADAEKELPWQSLARSNPSSCAGPPPSLDRTASEAEGAFTQRTRRLNPRDHHGMILLVIIDLAIWYLARPSHPSCRERWKALDRHRGPGLWAAC
jgi:hypothetical protein